MGRGRSPVFFRKANSYTGDYTTRQLDILNDDIPLENVRISEIAAIMKKTKARDDILNYDIAVGLYDCKLHPDHYGPPYSFEEAKTNLQSLTPWIINWDVI